MEELISYELNMVHRTKHDSFQFTFWLKQLGKSKCKVLLKDHILTGSDVTSKIGTKTSALKNNPDQLANFGEDELTHLSVLEAEKYLINVLYPKEKLYYV